MTLAPGIHDRVSLADYIADPAESPSLNSSIARVLLAQSPRHAWHRHPRLNSAWTPDAATPDMDLGTLCHALLFGAEQRPIVKIDAPDYKTKAAQFARDRARREGKIPALMHQYDQAATMVEIAFSAWAVSEITTLAGGLAGHRIENTLIWYEDRTFCCRCRPDWIARDSRVILDYKTTRASAEPDAFSRSLEDRGDDLQAAFALRAVQALLQPRGEITYVLMAQEMEAPYAVSFVGLSPAWVALAHAKFDAALTLWRTCLESGKWPGYPSRIAYVEPPPWSIARWEGRPGGDFASPSSANAANDGRSLANQLFGEPARGE